LISTTVSATPASSGIPRTTAHVVWEPFELRITDASARPDADAGGPAGELAEAAAGPIAAFLLRFDDAIGFFEPGHAVSKLEDGEIVDVAAKSLAPGDRVLLVDGGARRDLFDVIVEKLERLPEFEATTLLIREWHERARLAGLDHNLAPDEILRRMGSDAQVTSTQAIVTWIRGKVHGPLHTDDIRLFGHAVGDTFLEQRWEAIGRALSSFRAHRRRVGQMLGKVLDGTNPVELEDAGYFDRRLGIHYSDLTEALSVHTLVTRSTETTLVDGEFANRVLSATEADRLDTIVIPGAPIP
jgi:hypothetical protein